MKGDGHKEHKETQKRGGDRRGGRLNNFINYQLSKTFMSDLNDIAKKYYWTDAQREAVDELLELLEDRVEGVAWAEVIEGREMSAYPVLRFAFEERVFSEEILVTRAEDMWLVEILTGAEGFGVYFHDDKDVFRYVAGKLADEVKEMNQRLHDRTQGFLRRAAEDQREICRLREQLLRSNRIVRGMAEAVVAGFAVRHKLPFELEAVAHVDEKKEGA